MTGYFENYARFSSLLFVINAIGDIFVKAINLTSVVRQFVHGEEILQKDEDKTAVACFQAETESML